MSPEAFAILAAALEYLPPSFEQKWDKGARSFYFKALEDIPDTDAPVIAKLVSSQFIKRPTPAEILAKWREVVAPPKRTAADLVAAIYKAIEQPQIREVMVEQEVFVPDPGQDEIRAAHRKHLQSCLEASAKQGRSKGLGAAVPAFVPAADLPEIQGHYEKRMVPMQMYSFDMPQWVKYDPALVQIVDAYGGWESIKWARDEAARKHVWFIAKSVVDGMPKDEIASLRLEYQRARELSYTQAAQLEGYDNGEEY